MYGLYRKNPTYPTLHIHFAVIIYTFHNRIFHCKFRNKPNEHVQQLNIFSKHDILFLSRVSQFIHYRFKVNINTDKFAGYC